MKKIISAIAGVVFATAALCSCAGNGGNMIKITPETQYVRAEKREAAPVYAQTYDILGGRDVMPIGIFSGPYTPKIDVINGIEIPDYLTDYYFEVFKECGINNIVTTNEPYSMLNDEVMKALDLSYKHGMGYFVWDPAFGATTAVGQMAELCARYIDHPACIGIHVTDEPKANRFDDLKAIYDAYASEVGRTADRPLYTNMLPNYGVAFSGTSEAMSYEEYLRAYLEKVQTQFLSYDYYPFLEPDTGVDNMRPYFDNLAIVKKLSTEYHIPFWVYIQTGCYWDKPQDTGPLFPNEAEFLWNVNTSIAYGAKSIQYFMGIQWERESYELDGNRNFERLGLLGATGNKNQWYYYAQKAHKELLAADHILMNASNQGMIAKGARASKNLVADDVFETDSFRELQSVDAEDAVIGCFDYFGSTALYVVSNDVHKKQTVKLNFDNNYGYEIIQRGESFKVAARTVTLNIEAGEGVLVRLLTE